MLTIPRIILRITPARKLGFSVELVPVPHYVRKRNPNILHMIYCKATQNNSELIKKHFGNNMAHSTLDKQLRHTLPASTAGVRY